MSTTPTLTIGECTIALSAAHIVHRLNDAERVRTGRKILVQPRFATVRTVDGATGYALDDDADLDDLDVFALDDADLTEKDDRYRSSVIVPADVASGKMVTIGTAAGEATLALARYNAAKKGKRFGVRCADSVTIGGKVWSFALAARPYADGSGALLRAEMTLG